MPFARVPLVRRSALALCVVASLAATWVLVPEQGHRLSAPLPPFFSGEVFAFQVTPDGQSVVYAAEQDTAGFLDLYVRSTDGSGAPVQLNGPFELGLSISWLGILISSDSSHVVSAIRTPGNTVRIFSRPLNGGPAHLLSDPIPANTYYQEDQVELSPDGQWVVYRADHDTPGVFALYAAPIDGSSPRVLLDPDIIAAGDVTDFVVAPDSARVLYRADELVNGVFELFSVPIDGSAAPVRLNDDFVAGGDIQTTNPFAPSNSFLAVADSSRVVYLADGDTNDQFQLYSVPIDGSTLPIVLNEGLPANGDVNTFRLSPDGAHVAYSADQDVNDRVDLRVVPVDGSAASALLNGTENGISWFDYALDGSRIAYIASVPATGNDEMFSVLSDGSTASLLLSDMPSMAVADVQPFFSIAPDSSRVVYQADRDAADQFELYSVLLDGSSPPVELNLPLPAGADVYGHGISADSSRVVYHAGQNVANREELYTVPIDGSAAALPVNPPVLTDGETFGDFKLTDTSVVFRGDITLDEIIELHSAPLDASQPAVVLNDPLAPSSMYDVGGVKLSPDGNWAVYTIANGNFGDLYSVPLNTAAPARRLSVGRLFTSAFAEPPVLFSADSSTVYFTSYDGPPFDLPISLWRVPIDGSAAPTLLSDPTPGSNLNVGRFAVSPDGSQLAFSTTDYFGSLGLFVTPADGSQPPAFLGGGSWPMYTPDGSRVAFVNSHRFGASLHSAPSDASGPVATLSVSGGTFAYLGGWEMTPDGSRMVYTFDAQGELGTGEYLLYSALTDVTQSQTQISGSLPAGGDVIDFALTPDGTRAVYRADQDTNDVIELYIVPVDGSASDVKLSTVPVAGGSVTEFLLTPDGTRAVYVADQEVDERFEVYSVLLDGSAPATKLNPTLVADADVTAIEVSPDGTRVLYLADQQSDEVQELYSVPVTGGAAVKLHHALSGDQDVEPEFAFLPDGDGVLFRGDLRQADTIELWLAPVDGSRLAQRKSERLAAGQHVHPFFLATPDGEDLLYRADERTPNVIELFRWPLSKLLPANDPPVLVPRRRL